MFLGFGDGSQVPLAAEFYELATGGLSLKGEGNILAGDNIILTGHSLGGALTAIVEAEVRAVLPDPSDPGAIDVARFARSLIATVHGHCSYHVSGSFALLDEPDPTGAALARVRECLSAQGVRAT